MKLECTKTCPLTLKKTDVMIFIEVGDFITSAACSSDIQDVSKVTAVNSDGIIELKHLTHNYPMSPIRPNRITVTELAHMHYGDLIRYDRSDYSTESLDTMRYLNDLLAEGNYIG